jgi:hypothetical protein
MSTRHSSLAAVTVAVIAVCAAACGTAARTSTTSTPQPTAVQILHEARVPNVVDDGTVAGVRTAATGKFANSADEEAVVYTWGTQAAADAFIAQSPTDSTSVQIEGHLFTMSVDVDGTANQPNVVFPVPPATLAARVHGTVTPPAAPVYSASTPPGQPGASPPPSAACLTAGNCTVAQQQQVAAGMGITNPGGLNGCLVSGDCTASQQEGIAAGTSAGGSSPAPAPASTTETLNWTCTVTAAEPWGSDLWKVSFTLTAANDGSVPADITNGPTATFTDQAGDATDSYPVTWAQVIEPGSSASYVGSDYISAPASSAPATCQVAEWN